MNLKFARWSVGLVSDITAAVKSNVLRNPPIAFKYAAGEASGSGAWAEATASEHTCCAPFNGKRAIVTGATRGVGREVALGLAARGWEVIGTGRSIEAGAKLAAEVAARGGRLSFAELRLDQSELSTGNTASPLIGDDAEQGLASLDAAASTEGWHNVPSTPFTPGHYFAAWASKHASSPSEGGECRPIDLLVNNAGAMGAHLTRGIVADVNCLAPASLTLSLLPSLQASPLQSTTSQPAVVVNVASSAHIRASVPLSSDHHQFSSCFKEALTPTGIAAQELDLNRDQYANSKFGLLLFSRALRHRLALSNQANISRDIVAAEKAEFSLMSGKSAQNATKRTQRSVVVRDCHPGLVWTSLLTASLLGSAQKNKGRNKEDARSGSSTNVEDNFTRGLSRGIALKAALLRPLFFSPRRGAAVVLEAALQPMASDVYGVADEKRWAAESTSYFNPSGVPGAPAGLTEAGHAAVIAADAFVDERIDSIARAQGTTLAEEVLDSSAERMWELVQAYAENATCE